MFKRIKNKQGQDEMVGFGLIIIIIGIILLVVVSFTIKKPVKENVESYEINAFIQSVLQYTTDCKINSEFVDIRDLIFVCNQKATCSNGIDSCLFLKNTLKDILKESWKTGEKEIVKGYELAIISGGNKVIEIVEGTVDSQNYKGNYQKFARGGESVDFFFTAYY